MERDEQPANELTALLEWLHERTARIARGEDEKEHVRAIEGYKQASDTTSQILEELKRRHPDDIGISESIEEHENERISFVEGLKDFFDPTKRIKNSIGDDEFHVVLSGFHTQGADMPSEAFEHVHSAYIYGDVLSIAMVDSRGGGAWTSRIHPDKSLPGFSVTQENIVGSQLALSTDEKPGDLPSEMLEGHIHFLSQITNSPNSYLLVDDQMLEAARIAKQTPQINAVSAKRSEQLYLGLNILEIIPGFDNLDSDEAVDIRKQLEEYLVPFRSGVVELTRTISNNEILDDPRAAAQIARDIYVEQVSPLSKELRELVGGKNFMRNLVGRLAVNKGFRSSLIAMSISTAANTGSYAVEALAELEPYFPKATLGAASVVALGGLTIEISNSKKRMSSVEENKMYLVAKASRLINN